MLSTGILPGFCSFVGLSRGKDAQSRLSQQLQRARNSSASQLESLFGEVVPADELDRFSIRKRRYCQRNTFWAYVGQILGDGGSQGSLRDAVRGLQANQGQPGSASTAGYAQARMRLSPGLIQRVHERLRAGFDARQGDVDGFAGRRIRLVDATTVSAADTEVNQVVFPQPLQCEAGCGFPLIRITALFDLNTASLVKASVTNTDTGELTATVVDLLDELKPGDILVGDRCYQAYGLMAATLQRKADVLVRVKEQKLPTFERLKGGRCGDRMVRIKRPQNRNEVYDDCWRDFPRELTLRLVSFAGQSRDGQRQTIHLLTSLTDHKAYPAKAIARLYRRRWQIETGFGELKTTMGMDRLRSKSPAMVEKDIAMFLVSYNLIRYLHLQVSLRYDVPLEQLSVKGTIDAALRFAPVIHHHRYIRRKAQALYDQLIALIFQDRLKPRPGRSEPRKRKHRNRGKEWLTRPRETYKNNTVIP